MAETQLRIALLIDADNAPAEMIDEILNELSTLGVINIRRAYGNWTKAGLKSWESKLLEFALRPMQQYDYSKRKNATDMAMTVDAMELLYTEKPDAFGIVSSDADFTPLVMHLRAKGRPSMALAWPRHPSPSSTPARAFCTWRRWAACRARMRKPRSKARVGPAAARWSRGPRRHAPRRRQLAGSRRSGRSLCLLRRRHRPRRPMPVPGGGGGPCQAAPARAACAGR
jgi:uncharacterized protein (TIGR00288 family)